MAVIGFILNPIAGMGGRVGLKGTDSVEAEARRRGAEPSACRRAMVMLQALKERLRSEPNAPTITWLTCAGEMGADVLGEAGYAPDRLVGRPKAGPSSARDTKAAAAEFLAAGVDLLLFCGGDGTARDIADVVDSHTSMLGIPAGVKMYSGVFGVSPVRTAETCVRFLKGELRPVEAEILDLDEEKYRVGEWTIRLHHTALTPFEQTLTQLSKQLIVETSEAEAKTEIAGYLAEIIGTDDDTLFILGPGSTLQAVADAMGLCKTLLGLDAVVAARLAGRDLNEKDILALLEHHPHCKLVLSPIGAQGFVLGRGNLQLSPVALRQIGTRNLLLAATPAKLARTPQLHLDTGDSRLDAEIAAPGYLPVIVGYRRERLVKIVV